MDRNTVQSGKRAGDHGQDQRIYSVKEVGFGRQSGLRPRRGHCADSTKRRGTNPGRRGPSNAGTESSEAMAGSRVRLVDRD